MSHHHHHCGGGWNRGAWAMGPGGHSPFGGRGGRGGPFGRHRDGPFGGRGPRMFDPGALRLVVLGLIAEQPRHGYDIIKALEAKFDGAYSPSPGAIYPMLQMLEEADLVASQADGNKRLYAISDAGRAYLEENAAELARINAQIDQASNEAGGASLGEEIRALRDAVKGMMRGRTLGSDDARKALDILRRARTELEKLGKP